MEVPDIISGTSNLVPEGDFIEACEKLWTETRFIMGLYGKDTQGSIIEIGDLIGKFENGDISPYVVCFISDKSFYLADYRMLDSINKGDINNIADLHSQSSSRIGKINSNKKVVKIPHNVIPELTRDKYSELQRKIIEIHEQN